MNNCKHNFQIISDEKVCINCGLIQMHFVEKPIYTHINRKDIRYDFSIYTNEKYILKLLNENHLLNQDFQRFVILVFKYLDKNKTSIRLTKIKQKINTLYKYFYNTDKIFLDIKSNNKFDDDIPKTLMELYYKLIFYNKERHM